MNFETGVRDALKRKPVIINMDEIRDEATCVAFIEEQEKNGINVTSSAYGTATGLYVSKTRDGMSHFMDVKLPEDKK